MTAKLLVLADLGRFKAFRLEESRNFSNPRLRLIEDWETNVAHHLAEDLTDQAGRRSSAPGSLVKSDGEHHNLDLERRRRALKTVAKRVGELLEREQVDSCYFAADPQINQAILDEMDLGTRSRITKNVSANLTKLESSQVVDHFSE